MFKNMFKEFKEFAVKGDAVDLAVGVIIGAAFAAITKSLVDDIIMPIVSLITGRVDFPNLFIVLKPGTPDVEYATLASAKAAGAVTINYGAFLNSVVTFLIVAFVVFLVVRGINKLRNKPMVPPDTTRPCPYCLTDVPKAAVKCPACASDIEPVA